MRFITTLVIDFASSGTQAKDTWWMERHWMLRATMPCTEAVNTTCRARMLLCTRFKVPGIPDLLEEAANQIQVAHGAIHVRSNRGSLCRMILHHLAMHTALSATEA